MVKVGYLFPGQGAQYVGMGKDFYEQFTQARKIFDSANGVLDIDIKKLCFEGPKEELDRTDISQPAILTASIAALRALEQGARGKGRGTRDDYSVVAAAGLSLGEYSALVAAGAISFEDAVRLVSKRGRFMQEAAAKNPGSMICVLGLGREAVEGVCAESAAHIANLNCPGQIVISGTKEALVKAQEIARQKGAKRIAPLAVSGPFHSALMDEAAERLKAELDGISINKPKFKIAANVDAAYTSRPDKIRQNLIRQVNSPVLWEDSVRLMLADGIAEFLEIGPGNVLKGLLKKIDPELKVHNVGTVEEIENLMTNF